MAMVKVKVNEDGSQKPMTMDGHLKSRFNALNYHGIETLRWSNRRLFSVE